MKEKKKMTNELSEVLQAPICRNNLNDDDDNDDDAGVLWGGECVPETEQGNEKTF